MERFLIDALVAHALAEDLSYGDATTDLVVAQDIRAVGHLMAHETLVITGIEVFEAVFQMLDPEVRFEVYHHTGQTAKSGEQIACVFSNARVLLKGERTALNFMQRLSGIATLTRRYVEAVSGTSAKITDTRKTTPGLRALEKEAVCVGGGSNHRAHLGEMILIKDNHIALSGGIGQAMASVRAQMTKSCRIEVEITHEAQIQEALDCGCEIIMLDNMNLASIEKAVSRIRAQSPATRIEVSGGVRLENVAEIARCGVDFISVGALTHSAPAVDLSLDVLNV